MSTEYYNGSISQEPRFTAKINEQANIKLMQDRLYYDCLLPQFDLENLGINYLKGYDLAITLDLYDKVISFIDKSYIHINHNTIILEDNIKKMFFGKSLYELFFVDIPKTDIYEFKNISGDLRNFLIDYYITKTKRYESFKQLNKTLEFDYLIIKNSIAATIFDANIDNFKSKYFDVLISRLE
jgi:hypothetical protein